MPNYCEIETESFGQLFAKCGTKEIAGRISNSSSSAGDDYIIVSHYSFDGFASQYSGSLETAGFTLSITVPLMPPAVASVFNVLNSKNKIKKMTLKIVDGVGTMRNTVVGQYTAEDGQILSASILDSSQRDSSQSLNIVMDFDKVTFDNMLTHTTGTIKTSNSGD